MKLRPITAAMALAALAACGQDVTPQSGDTAPQASAAAPSTPPAQPEQAAAEQGEKKSD